MIVEEYNEKKIPDMEVYELGDVYDNYKDLIKNSNILDFSPKVQAWTSSASTRALSYYSHGIFRYFGKFPSVVARHLISEYTSEKDFVIDPMCGSGTTALEALLLNRAALCSDINPLSTLISKVKITKIDKKVALNYFEKLKSCIKKNNSKYTYDLVGLKNPEHWFLEETIVSLSKIKSAIHNLKMEDKYENLFMVAFLAVVRRVSTATTQQGRLFLDIDTAIKDAFPFFEKKALDMIESLSLIPENKNIKIIQESALTISNERKANLIICHPPYFNSYKYSGINSLELAWYGEDHANIRRNEIREFFKVGKPEKVDIYVNDMAKVLTNINNLLDSNGRLALMTGDTVIKGKYIPVTQMLIKAVSNIFDVELSTLRIPKFTEASWVASQRRKSDNVGINLCDLIVILKKKN